MTTANEGPLQRGLAALVSEGKTMLHRSAQRMEEGVRLDLHGYQKWYTKGLASVKQVLPDHADEFVEYYQGAGAPRGRVSMESFRIRDYLLDRWPSQAQAKSPAQATREAESVIFNLVRQQVLIIEAVSTHLTDTLRDLRGSIQRDLFENELDAARVLWHNGHLRAAGTLAGVVLEGYLQAQTRKHGIGIPADKASVGALNDGLKKKGAVDSIQWGKIQTLGRLRNLCAHKGEREPTTKDVEDLLGGVAELVSQPLDSAIQTRPV